MLTERQEELFDQLHKLAESTDVTDELNVHHDGEGFMIGMGADGHGTTWWLSDETGRRLARHMMDYYERADAIRRELENSLAPHPTQ